MFQRTYNPLASIDVTLAKLESEVVKTHNIAYTAACRFVDDEKVRVRYIFDGADPTHRDITIMGYVDNVRRNLALLTEPKRNHLLQAFNVFNKKGLQELLHPYEEDVPVNQLISDAKVALSDIEITKVFYKDWIQYLEETKVERGTKKLKELREKHKRKPQHVPLLSIGEHFLVEEGHIPSNHGQNPEEIMRLLEKHPFITAKIFDAYADKLEIAGKVGKNLNFLICGSAPNRNYSPHSVVQNRLRLPNRVYTELEQFRLVLIRRSMRRLWDSLPKQLPL